MDLFLCFWHIVKLSVASITSVSLWFFTFSAVSHQPAKRSSLSFCFSVSPLLDL